MLGKVTRAWFFFSFENTHFKVLYNLYSYFHKKVKLSGVPSTQNKTADIFSFLFKSKNCSKKHDMYNTKKFKLKYISSFHWVKNKNIFTLGSCNLKHDNVQRKILERTLKCHFGQNFPDFTNFDFKNIFPV